MAESASEIASCQAPRFPSAATWEGGGGAKTQNDLVTLFNVFFVFRVAAQWMNVVRGVYFPRKWNFFHTHLQHHSKNGRLTDGTHLFSVRADLTKKSLNQELIFFFFPHLFRLIAQEDIDPIHRKANVPVSFSLDNCSVASSVLPQCKSTTPTRQSTLVHFAWLSLLCAVKIERADAGRDRRTCIARLVSRARTGTGERYFPSSADPTRRTRN